MDKDEEVLSRYMGGDAVQYVLALRARVWMLAVIALLEAGMLAILFVALSRVRPC